MKDQAPPTVRAGVGRVVGDAEPSARTQLPLVAGFILLVLVACLSIFFVAGSHRFNAAVTRTLQVRTEAYHLLTMVQDAETGQRGYLLTHNRAYLEPYLVGSVEAPRTAAALNQLVASNDVQRATVERVRTLIDAKLAELASTLLPADKGDFAGALAIVKNDTGNNAMIAIRGEIDRFEAQEDRAQKALDASVELNNMLMAVMTVVGVVLIIGLGAYTIAVSRRATRSLMAAQGELSATNENLEGLVAERVSELQMANEEIQRFAYIVSHDLRAPLVNVMGFTSELEAARAQIADLVDAVTKVAPQLVTPDRKLAVETDLPEALGFIRSSTAKMDRLINAILKLSREGRRVLTPQPIGLRELIDAQGATLTQQLAAGDAELIVDRNLPDIISDRLAIEQIFGNLIENATKYLATGRPGRIEVSGKTHGSYVRYDIKDNGRGIETKDFERIFELFRRSGEQDKPGEGIGLAYVRNLARRLGGNVSVQSEFGSGSTFTVTLPSTLNIKARSMR